MKPFCFLALSFFLLSACVSNGHSPSPNPGPSIAPGSSPGSGSEVEIIRFEKPRGSLDYLCEPLKIPTRPALHLPTDIEVSPDGKTIYAVNGECTDHLGNTKSRGVPAEVGCRAPLDSNLKFTDLLRRFIYRLQIDSSQPEIVTIEGQPPLSCVLGDEIELDAKGNLYLIDRIRQRIYQAKDKLKLLAEIVEESSIGFQGSPPPPKLYFERIYSPVAQEDALYYSTVVDATTVSESILRKTDLNTLVTTSVYRSLSKLRQFEINDNHFYLGFYPEKLTIKDKNIEIINLKYSEDTIANLGFMIDSVADMVATGGSQTKVFYASDSAKHVIYKLVADAEHNLIDLKIFVGQFEQSGFQDGKGLNARLYAPTGLSLDAAGNLYVADTGNHAIRKITPTGEVSTFYKEQLPYHSR